MKKFYPTLILIMLFSCLGSLSTIAQNVQEFNLENNRLRQPLYLSGNEGIVKFCNLIKGEDYKIWANGTTKGCSPSIKHKTSEETEGTSVMTFTANEECMEFLFQKDLSTKGCDGEQYVSIGCQTCNSEKSDLQKQMALGVAGGFDDETLIKNVFIGGGCFDVENVEGKGAQEGKGIFSGGGSTISIGDGIILSSGSIYDALGPNNGEGTGQNVGGDTADPDLSLLATSSLHDVTGIEFDFQPTLNTIDFRYVFASEEYCEYVNSQFNDVFGFFISGPGISGGFSSDGENIATIPGGGFCSINSVNHLVNTTYFIGNSNSCGSTYNMNDIEFDGFTRVLTATANVIPCETYHIRLMISDVGDGIFDSAVFLEANSFNSEGTANGAALSFTTGTNVVYESCNDGLLTFIRADGDLSMDLVIDFDIDPTSTATSGVDFTPFPTPIIIPAGENSITIPFNVMNDGIPEGLESIIISFGNSCACSNTEIEIIIEDPPEVELELEDQAECGGIPIFLEPEVYGGIPGGFFTYEWNTGEQSPILIVTPTQNTSYTVTVTDMCGETATTSVDVQVGEIPIAIIEGLGFMCVGGEPDTFELNIDIQGEAPFELEYLHNGIPAGTINTSENNYTIIVNEPGTYELTNVVGSPIGCHGVGGGLGLIVGSDIANDLSTTPVTCLGLGSIDVTTDGGINPYTYQWSNGDTGPSIQNVDQGMHLVTVTDDIGCERVDSVLVGAEDVFEMEGEVLSGADCYDPSGGSIEVIITNGYAPVSYTWTNGIGNIPDPTGLAGGTYGVTVSDGLGCLDSLEFIVPSSIDLPAAVANADDFISCTLPEVLAEGTGSATGNGIVYNWTGPGIVGSPDSLNINVNQPGLYTLLVSNTLNGCESMDSVLIDQNIALPNAEATSGDLDCVITELEIDGSGSSTGPEFNYEWTGPGVVSGGNTLNPLIDDAGTYNLVVTNSINGCTAEAILDIVNNGDIPTSLVEPPSILTCDILDIILDGSASSSGTDYTYQWYDASGPINGENGATLNVTQPGNYELVVTDITNGCTEDYDVDVDQNILAPAVTADAAGVISCGETSTTVSASVSGDVTYQWTSPNGVIVSGETTPVATVGTPGDYIVLVTDNINGCTSEEMVTVEENTEIPEVQIEPEDQLDCETIALDLDATGSSQSGTMTYTWTTSNGNIVSGENTLTPNVDAPGEYVLTIFDNSNGCENTTSITIDQDIENPALSLPSLPILDCNVTSLDIESIVGNFPQSDLQFIWTTTNGVIDDGENTSTAIVSTPGTYNVLVTNSNNQCSSTAEITIGQDIEYPETAIAPPDILTCAANTTTINGFGSSTGTEFSYSWAGPGVLSGGNSLTPTVNVSGDYVLEITNTQNGCISSLSTFVDEDIVLPDADAGPTITLNCFDPQLSLSGNASTGAEFNYEWSGPSVINGVTTLTPVVDQPGDYVLLVTNVTNECTSTAMVTVDQDIATPDAEAGPGGELSCSVSEMSLDGTGSSTGQYTYTWTSSNGNILSGNTTLNPIINAPGTYTIEVTNTTNGCTSEDVVIIDQDDDLPQVDAGTAAPITCNVNEIILDGSGSDNGSDFIYEWSTSNGSIVSGSDTEAPVVNSPGVYVLTITNTLTDCTNLASVTVDDMTQQPAVEAGPTNVLTCTEETLTLDGFGTANGTEYTYQWSTTNGSIVSGANTLTPEIDAPGLYELIVTNQMTGCTSMDQVNITQDANAPLAAAATPGILTCDVEMLTLNGNGSSAGSGFTYAWSTSNGNILSGGSTLTPNINQPGTYEIMVTNLANGCTETAEIVVDQDIQNPTAEAGNSNDLTCAVTSLNLDAGGSSQGNNFVYNWSTQDGNIVFGGNTQVPVINEIGTYNLIVTNLNNGCTSSDIVVVGQDIENPSAAIATPNVLTCTIEEITLDGSGSQGTDFIYNWTTTNGNIVSGETTLEPIVDAPGTYTLMVSNEQNGCTEAAQIVVSEDVVYPNAEAGTAFVMDCFDEINYLDGNGSTGNANLLFAWSTTDGSLASGINTPEPGFTEPGTYQLTVTNSGNGCTDTDLIVITRDAPVIDPETMQPPCVGYKGAIIFSGTTGGMAPYLYSLDGGATFSSDPIYTGLDPADYEVIVQDSRGCEEDGIVTIIQPAEFVVTIVDFLEIDLGDSTQLLAQVNVPLDDIASVNWSPSTGLSCDDCLNPIVTPTESMTYLVEVKTKAGCEDNAPILLKVNKESNVFVPNIFSPNGDGVNDVFMIFADTKSILNVKSFLVFSRWGETVYQYFNFQPNNPAYGWDGLHRGETLNPQVFTWFAEIEFVDGETKVFKGDVTLAK